MKWLNHFVKHIYIFGVSCCRHEEATVDEGVSPTLRQWQLAEALRGYRTRRELTIAQAGEKLKSLGKRWSAAKLQRIETRGYSPKPPEIEQLAEAYELKKAERNELLDMAQDARKKGWWQSSALPKVFHTMAGLECAASTIREFGLAAVPGLLQTSDYARALMSVSDSPVAAEVLESRIAARMTRQHILRGMTPPELQVILAEGVLRNPVGGVRVMRGQLERLIDELANANVAMQVLPADVGAHPGVDGSFMILTIPSLEHDVGYCEGMMGSVYLETQEDVRSCNMRFAALSTLALSPDKSAKLMRNILAEYQLWKEAAR